MRARLERRCLHGKRWAFVAGPVFHEKQKRANLFDDRVRTAMRRRDCIRLGAAALATRLLPGGVALAQEKYPQSPIRLVVPYAPGGVVDTVARHWADRMEGLLGTVVIENQGGGGGTIGAASVSRAKPDGIRRA